MDQTPSLDGNILALDVGDVRIGVARAHSIAQIPEPLPVMKNDDMFFDNLKEYLKRHNPIKLVVGLPRNQHGEDTEQTKKVRKFAEAISANLSIPIVMVDEAYTSKDADIFLSQNKKLNYDQDSVAACYILSEYFKMSNNV